MAFICIFAHEGKEIWAMRQGNAPFFLRICGD